MAGMDQRVEAVRGFNRFYTRQIGVLDEGLLKSPFSLTEARVLYELAHRESPAPTALGKELRIDAGYLSRILRGFKKRGIVSITRSQTDGRQSLLRLTQRGRERFAELETRTRQQVSKMLRRLSPADQKRLIDAMQTVEGLLRGPGEKKPAYVLRPHQPGDMGWVIHRHGILYSQEYGWDQQFEALVAEIAAKFIRDFDPQRERCWIAELDGEIAGSVFLVKHSDDVAKLRLLLVEPKARGLGIGKRLVEECIRFAPQAGYRKITLWTNSILLAARGIYERAGFVLVQRESHHSFGHDLVSETWELTLPRVQP